MHLLIPYIHMPPNHPDPLFDEFTYGDVDVRARKLKSDLKEGDYIFFHTTTGGRKLITAYYVVDSVLDTVAACRDKAIRAKYKNPHLLDCIQAGAHTTSKDDAVVFGDPIRSLVPKRPLHLNRQLASKLSLAIAFPQNRSESQAIASATRAWRSLTEKDVKVLLKEIQAEQKRHRQLKLISSEEVAEIIEKDLEDFLALQPGLLGREWRLSGRQSPIASGRIDFLFENHEGHLLVVEVKLNKIGREALAQIRGYVKALQASSRKKVTGAIVCAGVMTAYEQDLRSQKDIAIFTYGWDLNVQSL